MGGGDSMLLPPPAERAVAAPHIRAYQLWLLIGVLWLPTSALRAQNLNLSELAMATSTDSASTSWLPEPLMWLLYEFAYHHIWQWLALVLCVVFIVGVRLLLTYVLRLVQNATTLTDWTWDDKIFAVIKSQITAVIALGCGYLFILSIGYTETLTEILGYGFKIVAALYIFRLFYRLIDVVPELIHASSNPYLAAIDPAVILLLVKIGKTLIAIMLPLVVLQNLGINVASVLAGLGLAGLAFSLAAKETAANFFGSLMILIDKPFDLGDWVIIDTYEGSVVEIGLRSTLIRTFYDSMITIPNAVVMNGVIDNMGKRTHRRIKTTLKVSYSTTTTQLGEFIRSIKTLLADHPHTVKNMDQHVVLSSFQDSSLGVLLYFFIDVTDWSQELLVRENIFMAIMDQAAVQGIELALPTQLIHLKAQEWPAAATPHPPTIPAASS